MRALSTPLVTEEAVREAEAARRPPSTETGAQLPPEEQPVQIPPPATARDGTGVRTSGGHRPPR